MVAWVGEPVCCAQPGAPRSGERTVRFLLSGPQLDTARAAEVVQEGGVEDRLVLPGAPLRTRCRRCQPS